MNEAFTSTSKIQTFMTWKGSINFAYFILTLYEYTFLNFSKQPTFKRDLDVKMMFYGRNGFGYYLAIWPIHIQFPPKQ